jgi:hypothetical protein
MTNRDLGPQGRANPASRKRGSRLGWVAAAVLLAAGTLVWLGYWLGMSTARGWREVAGKVSDPARVHDRAITLPQGSRVTYRGATVARLTTYRRLPREESLGGPLLALDGDWETTEIATRVRADTTLVGEATGKLEQEPLVVELRAPPPPGHDPRGLLRLRPFHRGYRVY